MNLSANETTDGTVPFFSVVVPCCDVEPYLRDCLDSLLAQPCSDWECLLEIEDSKDATETVVRGYAAKDARFRVSTGPRSGSCSVPRNRGVEAARGRYVVFLDGDDTLAPGGLQRIRDAISSRPGADLYPCALQVHDDNTGRDGELRDNYPPDAPPELSGPEATLLVYRHKNGHPHPQLQLTVFRRVFLLENGLRCVPGLRRQDSEFSPRALYLARRVVPLHVPYYIYRLREGAVGSAARGHGHFHGDWAVILRSLLAFHAQVSRAPGFDRRISPCWADPWISWVFYFWFAPRHVASIPRPQRLETLSALFAGGFGDFDRLLRVSPLSKRIAGGWVKAFVRHPAARALAEGFFRVYFRAADARNRPS